MEVLSKFREEANEVVEDFSTEFSELIENDLLLGLENNPEEQLIGLSSSIIVHISKNRKNVPFAQLFLNERLTKCGRSGGITYKDSH